MAGPARDGKDALIYYGTPGQTLKPEQLARYAAVGDSKSPNNKTNQPFGWSSKARSGELIFMLDGPNKAATDYFFRLENFNLGAYTTPNYYPSKDEITKKEVLQGGTPLIILAGESERNSIILPARQAEANWIANTKGGSNYYDSTIISRDFDIGRKLTLTGRGGDIVISGHGNDYIGPGLPIKAWQALGAAAKNGSEWTSALNGLDLGSEQLLTPTQANQAGATQVHPNFWVGKTPINGTTSKSGKKAYIGGSGDDLVWGGNESDLLIGDRYDSHETYFPSNEKSRQALYAAAGYTNTANSPIAELQKTRFTPTSYNGSTQKAPGYDFWYNNTIAEGYRNNYAYMNGPVDSKYFWTRTGSIIPEPLNKNTWGRSPQYDGSHTANEPVWTPGADIIYGGGGNDDIFGDNNLPATWRLEEAKALLDKANSDSYYNGTKNTFENWRQLGNDYLNGGDGDDNINGGFGIDHIVGGKGKDIIFLPDIITAPGFKNLIGKSGNVSWIAGGELTDTAKLKKDKSGVNSSVAGEADIYILGMHYTTEQAMKDTKYDDGGGASYEDETERLANLASTKWRNFANKVAWNVSKDLISNIPYAGDALSPILGIIDAMLEKENDPTNKGVKYNMPTASSDSAVVISDFSPTDLLVIPVPKGEGVDIDKKTGGTGLNINDPKFPGFYSNSNGMQITIGKQGSNYARVWLPGLTYDDNAIDPMYQFKKLKSFTDLKSYGISDSSTTSFGDNVDIFVFASKYFGAALGKDQGFAGNI